LHLGLLESRRSLAAEDLLTLIRANLPAIGGSAHVTAAAALASDVIDGRLARKRSTHTPFGRDADALADAAFWTWYTLRHVRRRAIRMAALAAFAAPVAAVTAASVARGRMVDAPRPRFSRPAAALQILLTARAIVIARARSRAGTAHRPESSHPLGQSAPIEDGD
jgi:phosphatidylglycerophosphate synthase